MRSGLHLWDPKRLPARAFWLRSIVSEAGWGLATSHVVRFCPRDADDPLVGSIAQEYLVDRPKHDKTAAEWTRRFAQCVPWSISGFPVLAS